MRWYCKAVLPEIAARVPNSLPQQVPRPETMSGPGAARRTRSGACRPRPHERAKSPILPGRFWRLIATAARARFCKHAQRRPRCTRGESTRNSTPRLVSFTHQAERQLDKIHIRPARRLRIRLGSPRGLVFCIGNWAGLEPPDLRRELKADKRAAPRPPTTKRLHIRLITECGSQRLPP